MALDIKVNDIKQVVEIDGVRYTYELFESWGKNGLPTGSIFRLEDRNDDGGNVMIKKLNLEKVKLILKTLIAVDEFKVETQEEILEIKKLYTDLFDEEI